MPSLRLRSNDSVNVMERRENMVEETFDAEGNNNESEYSLGNRQNLKDFMLDADEISVIGYTEDSNVQTSSTLADQGIRTRNGVISGSEHSNLVSEGVGEAADNATGNVIEENVVFRDQNAEVNGELRLKNASSLWQMVENEPIHMTLEEVQLSLYEWDGQVTAESNDNNQVPNRKAADDPASAAAAGSENSEADISKICGENVEENHRVAMKLPRQLSRHHHRPHSSSAERWPHSRSLKHTLCHWLGLGRCASADVNPSASSSSSEWPSCLPRVDTETAASRRNLDGGLLNDESRDLFSSIVNRALPPLPNEKCEKDDSAVCGEGDENSNSMATSVMVADRMIPDFAKSICKVKDCGWYWGPISGEMAERILSSEPDGSFVVRDSSDERYIFSLTFKLNGFVRHVRIEHDHGNFSFGSFTNFKSHTIVEFIENAVRHSRSGRYLFFLHRRPALGPMRVQLLYPVSRFKRVQSLQHMCRFVILKAVRRDLIASLPLPAKLKNYLDTQQYYTEQMQDIQSPVAASINFGQLEPTESVG